MNAGLDFYRAPGPMTTLPDHPALADVPSGLDALRRLVQGMLVHRDWAPRYGVEGDAIRIDEQNLRSTTDLLTRALEITERWDGTRWVREDPQIDELQAGIVDLDFDPYDQPPGQFLTGAEAWIKARAGDVDPMLFGIFDMFGLWFIAGNVILDFACLNKVELLPWDGWGMMTGPYEEPSPEAVAVLDDIAALSVADDFDGIRRRYLEDDRLRVPADITSFINDELGDVHLDLDLP